MVTSVPLLTVVIQHPALRQQAVTIYGVLCDVCTAQPPVPPLQVVVEVSS
jgi:hypothetical protein